MPCGWGGNRKSGVALVMRQTSMVYLPADYRFKKQMSISPTLLMEYGTLYLLHQTVQIVKPTCN